MLQPPHHQFSAQVTLCNIRTCKWEDFERLKIAFSHALQLIRLIWQE